ncbi:protein lin-54 homolog [Mixophyes fleayi]|uniref:protein lin-54 homolog n=1 Tax=Mixophyes fleayi TaxID=3061075 RepID=UPI003F4E1F49
MSVVSAEVNNALPDEIMETGMSIVDDDSIEAITITSPMVEEVPMETELDEIVEVNSSGTCITMSSGKEEVTTPSNHASHLAVVSVASKPSPGPSASAMKTVLQSGIHKLGAPLSGQMILNKASELTSGNRVVKQEKLIVTTLGKSSHPIVLIPQSQMSGTHKATQIQHVDFKGTPQQIKLVTIGGRTEVKPVLAMSSLSSAQIISPATKSSILHGQQIQNVQIAKKVPASSSGAVITKLIIAKPLNSKPLGSGQTTQVSSVFAGKVLSHINSGTTPKAIAISESGGVIGTSIESTTQTSNKIAISPLKSPPTKVTVVSVGSQPVNSPQKTVGVPISVALGQQLLTVQSSSSSSPAKAITTAVQSVKPGVQTITVSGVNTPQFKTIIPLAAAPNVQQIQVPGSKFHYVRLVTASTASSATPSCHNPSTSTQPLQQAKPMVVNATQVRMSVPIIPATAVKQVAPKPISASSQIVTTSQPQQRLLMPATPLAQIQPNLTNLPPGTVLTPAPGTGNVGYAVLPAQYGIQLQQSSYVSIASNAGISSNQGSQNQPRVPLNGIISSESTSRPRKPCNCTKSLCLKLYCDCFANGEFCNNCNCTNCYNNLEHENERQKAIKACLDRNPEAFKPKIGKGKEGESDRRHSKGCNCKRSGCLKNYCECYEAKIMCSSICKCIGCKNFEESPERKTLMHLADAAEVRVQQQTAAKTKLSSQISDLLTRPAPSLSSGGGKLPFTFVTKEVAEATCECLLAQAEHGEKLSKSKAATERMILEEFGRCLMRVINSAGKAKSDPYPMSC